MKAENRNKTNLFELVSIHWDLILGNLRFYLWMIQNPLQCYINSVFNSVFFFLMVLLLLFMVLQLINCERAKKISLTITAVRLQHSSDITTYNSCLFLNNTILRLQHHNHHTWLGTATFVFPSCLRVVGSTCFYFGMLVLFSL